MPTEKEVGIRRIPAYTLHYTTEYNGVLVHVFSLCKLTDEDMHFFLMVQL